MAEDNQYFILTRSEPTYSTFKPGRICYSPTYRYTALGPSKSLDVLFVGSYSALDYPVEVERLQPVSREEADLLMALPEGDRLEALNQGLDSALSLEVGTKVWVQEGSETLGGIIRYIGNITEPIGFRDLQGVFFGIELLGGDRGKGNTDGIFRFKRCFSCDKDCAVFAPFNRVTAVGSQTSPGPHPKRRPAMMHRPDPVQDPDHPMSFHTDHFYLSSGTESQVNLQQRESRPEEAKAWDSAPKPLSADPEPRSPSEPMEEEHLYEDPDLKSEPTKALNRLRSKSAKGGPSPGSEEPTTDGKNKPKSRFNLRPGSAKRAAPPRPEESKPNGRPQSEEPEHVKQKHKPHPQSWSEVAQGRPTTHRSPPGHGNRSLSEAEAELKARTRAGARSGLEPREGPKPGFNESLRRGSTGGLKTGDKVLFFDEKEQTLRGTVVFMEAEGDETVVHIARDSGTSCVLPLQCVMKLEPEPAAPHSDTEDIYMDPDATAPPADHSPERPEDCSSLGLDSVVEITVANGEKAFGTVRWIGILPGTKEQMAGLELEEKKGVSDGTFRGQRFFWCPDKYAMFVKLKSCRPDSRFFKKSTNHGAPNKNARANGLADPQNLNDPGETLPEPVPPISTEQVKDVLFGQMRGIQGHHNSCYMDSALFSLFCCSSVLDSLLFKSTQPQDAAIQKTLLRDIVNPLRRNGFVESRHVMNLRQQLQKHGFSQTFTTDEKDPEEFLTVIMHHILALDPLLKLSSGGKVQDSYCYQIFLDQNHSLVLPTVQQLLEHSFYSNALKLAEVPSCLILQMPRFGKKFKMFDKIIPSLELDVTELLAQGPKQCVLCGGGAHVECSECFLDPTFSQNGFKLFCNNCTAQVHAHPRRHGHRPAPLDIRYRGYRDSFQGNRDKLHLLAVLCIETSHYVSFVKYGPEPAQWLFYDSMADRMGEADGYNVPEVSPAPEVSQYLNMSVSELANQAPRDMKGVAKRLLCDAYLYLYQSPALSLYT